MKKRVNDDNEDVVSKQELLEEKVEKVNIQKELFEVYSQHELLLKKNQQLEQDYEQLLTRYEKLKNSKLGRLTIKYWKMRKKRRDK